MEWWATLCMLLLFLFVIYWTKYGYKIQSSFSQIPGPKGIPILGNALQFKNLKTLHRDFTKLGQTYGPIFKIKMLSRYFVMLSTYESISECLISKGNQFHTRPITWRTTYALKNTGILFQEPNNTWKLLRKLTQRHLKQFSEGMTQLETLITEIAEDMYETFSSHQDIPFDPRDAVFSTALKTIAFLLTGQQYDDRDPLLEQMRRHEPLLVKYVLGHVPFQMRVIEAFPVTRYLFRDTWKKIRSFPELEDDIWNAIKTRVNENPESNGLAKLLLSHAEFKTPSSGDTPMSETDAKRTCMTLLFAGISTTTNSFHALINLLAHHTDVQEKLFGQISQTVGSRKVSLDDRRDLPLVRAAIFELLRYFTVTGIGAGHKASMDNVTLLGYSIPRDVSILPNLWALHHDPEFWDDPDVFRPERFLDEYGGLVPPDHPNRKHLLPFGSGPRVCLGESMALARLFLWTANTIQHFSISPAHGNEKILTHVDSYYYQTLVFSRPYEVIFRKR